MSAVVLQGATAAAQGAPEVLPGRYEVAAGVSWTAWASLGSSDASLTASAGGRYRLFSTSTEIVAAPGVDVRIGRRLTSIIQVEIAAAYSSPTLRTSISNDVENGAATVASESIRQFTVTGAALFYLPRWHASRVLPFVTGGGGYLRQLHQGSVLVETGRIYYVGGGGTIPLTSHRTGESKQFGIRADVRALFRTGGVSLDGGTQVSPVVTVAAFVRF